MTRTGGLATVFGRRSVMVSALVIFAVGSAVAGAARNMGTMIIGRSFQGVGGGGELLIVHSIVTDKNNRVSACTRSSRCPVHVSNYRRGSGSFSREVRLLSFRS